MKYIKVVKKQKKERKDNYTWQALTPLHLDETESNYIQL